MSDLVLNVFVLENNSLWRFIIFLIKLTLGIVFFQILIDYLWVFNLLIDSFQNTESIKFSESLFSIPVTVLDSYTVPDPVQLIQEAIIGEKMNTL